MTHDQKDRLKITMTSDFICPWCFVAERRLKKAAAEEGIEVELNFKPFELNPDMPKDGLNRRIYRSQKFGSWERSMQLDLGTTQASKDDPLSFDYAAMEFTPNTRDAHRLVWYTQENAPELEEAVVDAIFEGYFSNGRNIGDIGVLAEIASDLGLRHDAVLAFLESEDEAPEVVTREQEAVGNGIRGVPHIQIGSMHLHGAESADKMRKALSEAVSDQKERSGTSI